MIPASRPTPPLSRSIACITFLAMLLLCVSAVSAATIAPIAQQTLNPDRILQPALTLVPVTTAPTVQTAACTAPAECLYESEAIVRWGTTGFTQSGRLPCFYNPAMVAAPTTKYCYQQKPVTVSPAATPVVQTISCTAPAECLYRSDAVSRWGETGFTQSAELPCFYNPAMVAAPTTKYCYQQKLLTLVPVTSLVPATTPVPVKTTTTQVVVSKPTTIPELCPGKALCNGACTDIFGSDSNNCGGCGWVCPSALTCYQGECVADCPTGFDNCQQYDCTDLRSDYANCGKCGNTCGTKETCANGKCTSLCSVQPATLTYFSWANWHDGNWMSPVRDQGACGSCWDEAPTGAAEAIRNIETGFRYPAGNLNLSEQAVLSGCYGDLGSCTGGDHEGALEVLKTKGVAEDFFLPYQSGSCAHDDGNGHLACNADITGHCSNPSTCTLPAVPANRIWKIQSYMKVSGNYAWTNAEAIDTVKKGILCHGPLTACSGNWWHCVDIVGWTGSTYDANGGWIVRNSWGTGWQSNGYAVLKYGLPLSNNKDEQLLGDIAMDAWYVQGVYHG